LRSIANHRAISRAALLLTLTSLLLACCGSDTLAGNAIAAEAADAPHEFRATAAGSALIDSIDLAYRLNVRSAIAAEAADAPDEFRATSGGGALIDSIDLAYRLNVRSASAEDVIAVDATDSPDDPGQPSPARDGLMTDDEKPLTLREPCLLAVQNQLRIDFSEADLDQASADENIAADRTDFADSDQPCPARSELMAGEEKPLTLIEACRLAMQNHPRIDLSEADLDEARADWGIARSQYYPRVEWLTTIGPSTDQDTGETGYADTALVLSQKFFKFGGIKDSVDSAELRFQSAQLESSRTSEDIAVLAINAFLTVLQSQELLRVHEKDVEFNKKLLESFKERHAGGVSSLADVQKMEVALKEAQARVVQQNEQFSTSKSLLENIIGVPVSFLEPDVNLLNVTIDGSIEESSQRALASNLKLKSLAKQIAAQHKSVSATRTDYLPELGCQVQVKNEFEELKAAGKFKQTTEAQLTLNWTLFSGHSTTHELLKKKASLRRLEAKRRSTELEIRNVLTDAMNSYGSTASEYALAKAAFDSSVELMALYLSEFDIGIRTLLELTSARDGQTSAALRQVNARFNRSRSALNILLEEGRLQNALNLPLDTLSVPQAE
jgi:adhesin transport system outer membrane protein